jgi:hypothetical protein
MTKLEKEIEVEVAKIMDDFKQMMNQTHGFYSTTNSALLAKSTQLNTLLSFIFKEIAKVKLTKVGVIWPESQEE